MKIPLKIKDCGNIKISGKTLRLLLTVSWETPRWIVITRTHIPQSHVELSSVRGSEKSEHRPLRVEYVYYHLKIPNIRYNHINYRIESMLSLTLNWKLFDTIAEIARNQYIIQVKEGQVYTFRELERLKMKDRDIKNLHDKY